MDRFWTMVDKKLQGPFEIAELMALPNFQEKMLICRQGDDDWKAAQEFSAIRQRMVIGQQAPTKTADSPVAAPKATPMKTSGDFISPDFQFAHFNPVKSAPAPRNPVPLKAVAPQAPARVVPANPPAARTPSAAKSKPLAKRRRVFVITVLSLMIMTGHLMVTFAGMPLSGFLAPYQFPQRKLQGTTFSQRTPHPARVMKRAKTEPFDLMQWVKAQAKEDRTSRVSRRPWFSKNDTSSKPTRRHSGRRNRHQS